MIVDCFFNDGEAQPGARLLGRKIRLKNFRDIVGRDAVSGIDDFYLNRVLARLRKLDRNAPAIAVDRLDLEAHLLEHVDDRPARILAEVHGRHGQPNLAGFGTSQRIARDIRTTTHEIAIEIIGLNKWFEQFHVLHDIDLKDGARVLGGIHVKKRNDDNWSWGRDEPVRVLVIYSPPYEELPERVIRP